MNEQGRTERKLWIQHEKKKNERHLIVRGGTRVSTGLDKFVF